MEDVKIGGQCGADTDTKGPVGQWHPLKAQGRGGDQRRAGDGKRPSGIPGTVSYTHLDVYKRQV